MPSDTLTTRTAARPAFNTKTLVSLAMLTALAFAAMVVCKVIPPIGGFLSLDAKDTVIAIGGCIFGVVPAFLMSVVVSLLEFLTVSDTGPFGLLMNIIATSAFVCPFVYIYRRKHNTSAAVLGLIAGVVTLTALMLLWNYIVTPIYYNMERELVVAMLPTLILPFNLVKGVLNSALIMLLYPPVVGALRKVGLVPKSQTQSGQPAKQKFNFVPTVISAVVLVTGILLALAMMKIL